MTVRPASKPSPATISSITSRGTAASVVIAIAARRPLPVSLLVWLAPDRGGDDVDAVLPEDRADPADHPGHVAVAEQRDVLLELDVEPLAPRLEQVRAVAAADQRAGDPDAVVAAGHVTRTRSV